MLVPALRHPLLAPWRAMGLQRFGRLSAWPIFALLLALLAATLIGAPAAAAGDGATAAAPTTSGAYAYDGRPHMSSRMQASSTLTVPAHVTTSRSAAARVGATSEAATGVAAEGALPSALTLGRNAEVGVDVYKGVRGGKDVYVGITNNLMRRGAEHGDRFALERLTATSVTRGEARAIEQAMIVRNPGFQNARNSISPNHAWYDDAVTWGESWLQRGGL